MPSKVGLLNVKVVLPHEKTQDGLIVTRNNISLDVFFGQNFVEKFFARSKMQEFTKKIIVIFSFLNKKTVGCNLGLVFVQSLRHVHRFVDLFFGVTFLTLHLTKKESSVP
jgi:hypothetical protein